MRRAVNWWKKFLGRFSGALLAMAVVVPGVGAVSVAILYVYRGDGAPGDDRRVDPDSVWLSGTEAYVFGTAAAIIFWLVLAFLFRGRLASARNANTSVYNELREQYDLAASRVASLVKDSAATRDPTERSALAEAEAQLAACDKELDPDERQATAPGSDWVLATGYTALWRRLHRAQEALLLVEPACEVAGTAMYDRARLENSAIPGREQLLGQLRAATLVLAPAAQVYEPATDGKTNRALASASNSSSSREPRGRSDRVPLVSRLIAIRRRAAAPSRPDPRVAECQARMVIRNIAQIINEFRDDRREGLIRARNNLYRTVFVTALTAYLLFGLALIRGVDELAVVAMASFYLVGGILGLFRQLGQASSIDTVKETDYGLSTARLIHAPLFSGLAAVGGVVLVAVLGAVIPSGVEGPEIPDLRDIFDLGRNQFGLVAAAVFGLTPNLLSQRLEKQAEQYKDELKSTEASGAISTTIATD